MGAGLQRRQANLWRFHARRADLGCLQPGRRLAPNGRQKAALRFHDGENYQCGGSEQISHSRISQGLGTHERSVISIKGIPVTRGSWDIPFLSHSKNRGNLPAPNSNANPGESLLMRSPCHSACVLIPNGRTATPHEYQKSLVNVMPSAPWKGGSSQCGAGYWSSLGSSYWSHIELTSNQKERDCRLPAELSGRAKEWIPRWRLSCVRQRLNRRVLFAACCCPTAIVLQRCQQTRKDLTERQHIRRP